MADFSMEKLRDCRDRVAETVPSLAGADLNNPSIALGIYAISALLEGEPFPVSLWDDEADTYETFRIVPGSDGMPSSIDMDFPLSDNAAGVASSILEFADRVLPMLNQRLGGQ